MMLESEFQDSVIDIAKWTKWGIHHDRPGQNRAGRWSTAIVGDVGFPDLVLVRPPRLVVAELKTDRGSLTEAQKLWLLGFAGCDAEVYVWRPADLEAIAEILNPAQATRPTNPAGLFGQATLI